MREIGRVFEDFGVLGGILICTGGLGFTIYQITTEVSLAVDRSGLLTLAQ